MNVNAEKYIEQAEKYIHQGDKEIKEGDLRQAGEKYWGAATQILKAYCEMKGCPHDGHAKLFQDVGEISKEIGDQKIREEFCLASTLHTNFYEGWLTKEEVEDCALQSKEFIKKIKTLIEGETLRQTSFDTPLSEETPRLPSADTPLSEGNGR